MAIQQLYPAQPTEISASADVANRDVLTAPQPMPQTKVPDKTTTRAARAATITPVATPQSSGGFFVKKVPASFVLDTANEEPTLLLSVTTEPRPEDPAKLSLCMTLTDEKDSAVSETDCIPLEKYGTWSVMTNYDLSLAPNPDRMDYWTVGHHPTRVRFELVGAKINDYSGTAARSRNAVLASDNTGTFDFYLHQ